MISFINKAPAFSSLASLFAPPLSTPQLASLLIPLKSGYCDVLNGSGGTIEAASASAQLCDVIALLGVKSAANEASYVVTFEDSASAVTGETIELDQPTSSLIQSRNFAAILSARRLVDNVQMIFDARTNDSHVRQLWIGPAIRLKPSLTMLRSTSGGAEIVQAPSGAVMVNERATWRVYNCAFNGVTDADWYGELGFEGLESIGDGAEVLILPTGQPTDATTGGMALHGYMTGFRTTQKRGGLRGVEFTVTECR